MTTSGRKLPQPVITDAQLGTLGTTVKLSWKLADDEKRTEGWVYGKEGWDGSGFGSIFGSKFHGSGVPNSSTRGQWPFRPAGREAMMRTQSLHMFPCFSGFKMPSVDQFHKTSGLENLRHLIHQILTMSH